MSCRQRPLQLQAVGRSLVRAKLVSGWRTKERQPRCTHSVLLSVAELPSRNELPTPLALVDFLIGEESDTCAPGWGLVVGILFKRQIRQLFKKYRSYIRVTTYEGLTIE